MYFKQFGLSAGTVPANSFSSDVTFAHGINTSIYKIVAAFSNTNWFGLSNLPAVENENIVAKVFNHYASAQPMVVSVTVIYQLK